jgi:hypothetical protein
MSLASGKYTIKNVQHQNVLYLNDGIDGAGIVGRPYDSQREAQVALSL